MRKLDAITGPAYYYNGGKAEQGPLDYAEQQELNIKQHAVIKYVTRAGRKPGNSALKDYKQAKFYLDRLIAEEESKENNSSMGMVLVTNVLAEKFEPKAASLYCTRCEHDLSDDGSCGGNEPCNCPDTCHKTR